MIEFPGLWGLKFSINEVAFTVFNVEIFWYGIIIAVGFMLAVLLAMRDSSSFGLDSESIIDLMLWAAPIAIICARIYYVVFSWENYRDNLWEIVNLRHGGIAIYGAVIGAVATAYIFARYKRIPPLKLFDFCTPFLVLAQSIGRWGNFVNQEAFGTNTLLPWGMTGDRIKRELLRLKEVEGMNVDPNIPVHPTFLYESLWNLGVFFLLIWFRRRKRIEGEVFFMYMALYGLGRFWIEGLRTDSLMLGNLRVSQVLAFLFVIAFAAVFVIRRKKLQELESLEVVTGLSEYGSVLKKMKEDDIAPETENEIETVDNETGSDNAEPGNDENKGN